MAIPVPDIGPRTVAIGDPTTALGAGMLIVPNVRNLNITATPNVKTGTTATGAENHEGKFYLNTQLEVSFEVPRAVASDVRDYIEIVDTDGDYLALGASMPKITLALIHPDDYASGSASTSAKTRWVPSVRLETIAPQNFNADQSGADDTNFVMLTFQAGYIATDQDDNDVPEDALPDFRGDRLATHGLDSAWFLPMPYGASS